MSRDVAIFGRYWKATTFSSVVQPTIYLLAFGLGFGALHAARSAHVKLRCEYVATGVGRDGGAVLLGLPGHVQHVRALAVPAHLRRDAGGAGRRRGADHRRDAVDLAARRRLRPGAAARRVRVRPGTRMRGCCSCRSIGFVTGFGFAAFGVLIAAVAKTIDNFNYVTSAVLTPMFLVAGTFFPVSTLPDGVRQIAQINPLYHCVQLVRDASLGDLQLGRSRPRRRAARLRAADVAPGDLAARQAPDRLSAGALSELSGCSHAAPTAGAAMLRP